MTNFAKCQKPGGSCWTEEEELAVYSELAIFWKRNSYLQGTVSWNTLCLCMQLFH